MTRRFPIFRMSGQGHTIFYNTSNHATVKDEFTAREAFLDDTGYEPTRVSSFTFDETHSISDLTDFAHYGWE